MAGYYVQCKCGAYCDVEPCDRCSQAKSSSPGPEEPEPKPCPHTILRRQWITPLILSIAQSAYDERQDDGTLDNERLMILSDALEDAGLPGEVECRACGGLGYVTKNNHGQTGKRTHHACPAACRFGIATHPLLAALRAPGPHYPGMAALDLILGRS